MNCSLVAYVFTSILPVQKCLIYYIMLAMRMTDLCLYILDYSSRDQERYESGIGMILRELILMFWHSMLVGNWLHVGMFDHTSDGARWCIDPAKQEIIQWYVRIHHGHTVDVMMTDLWYITHPHDRIATILPATYYKDKILNAFTKPSYIFHEWVKKSSWKKYSKKITKLWWNGRRLFME